MKATVVPAQITTVEDKIAGSLTFVQIILLVMALIFGTALYGLIPPKLHLNTIKMIPIIAECAFFGLLALRVKGRIVAEWLIIYLRFKLRPRIYVFTKNDLYGREPLTETIALAKEKVPAKAVRKVKRSNTKRNIIENPLIENPAAIISIKPSKKGGLDVIYREA